MKIKLTHIVIIVLSIFLSNCVESRLLETERYRVINAAEKYLEEEPVTITSFICERSAGTIHDYYSEGDYWWMNPNDPEGPYIRKDGLTNPDNFTEHRKVLRKLSIVVPALVAAYKITGDERFAKHAIKYLNAWFVNEDTKMNSNLMFAQAIKGRVTGRGIGIIDTIHLVEVARAIEILNELNAIDNENFEKIKVWFSEYLTWITTHQFGIDERDNGNNHSTCWAMQTSMYARLVGDEETLQFVRDFFMEVLIPSQMAEDGSFPKELKRTKPYGYSIFNLDAMSMVAEIAGNSNNDLWKFKTKDGMGLQSAVEFLFPYIKNKETWAYQKDVMYWDDWPVRQPFLLFASIHFDRPEYFELWNKLEPDPEKEEIIRNFPIRQPILWVDL